MTDNITRKNNGIKLLGYDTGIFTSFTKEFKEFKNKLISGKSEQLRSYKNDIQKPENIKFGFEYPNETIYNFEENYLGNLIIIQEINLRRLIVKALSQQKNLFNFNIYNLIPFSSKQLFSGAFCLILRYKRLYDFFYRASTIRKETYDFFSLERWYNPDKDIRTEFNLPTLAQMETIVKYSLDTPICLSIILGNNGFKQFDTKGNELKIGKKYSYLPNGIGKNSISLGLNTTTNVMMSINTDGIIISGDGNNKKIYNIVGINFRDINKNLINTHETKPDINSNEKGIDILNKRNVFQQTIDWFGHRFMGDDSLPTEDNWKLPWEFQDEELHKSVFYKFKEYYNEDNKSTRIQLIKNGGKNTRKIYKR